MVKPTYVKTLIDQWGIEQRALQDESTRHEKTAGVINETYTSKLLELIPEELQGEARKLEVLRDEGLQNEQQRYEKVSDSLNKRAGETASLIKSAVLELKRTIKGDTHMAVYSPATPKVDDIKGLLGLAKAVPEIMDFIGEKAAYVSLRESK